MAGTIAFSLSQQLDALGAPLAGGRLYFFESGTTNPQAAYQDSALTILHPNPIVLDAAGRVPQFFLADGLIKIRLTSATGVLQVAADSLQVIGASSGSGGGGTVDPTTIFQTGDEKWRYDTGAHSGWVRENGLTLGSATSGATERANADCEPLFLHLYGVDTSLAVSGGRGVSAAADWAANKTIALPDMRGRTDAALDAMGNSSAGRLTSTYFGTSAIVLGAHGGAEYHALTEAELAAHNHGWKLNQGSDGNQNLSDVNYLARRGAPTGDTPARATSDGTNEVMITNAGNGDSHNNVQPTMLKTKYIKL